MGSQVLLVDARYEIKKGYFDSIEEQYCNMLSKIQDYFGIRVYILWERGDFIKGKTETAAKNVGGEFLSAHLQYFDRLDHFL